MQPRRLALDPGAAAGRLEGRHALRQQRGDAARQHVAGAARRQAGRCIGVDGGAAVGGRDHGIGALQQQHGTGRRRRGAGGGQFVGTHGPEDPGEFAGMRRQHGAAGQGLRRASAGRQRTGIGHHPPPGLDQPAQGGAGAVVAGQARADQPGAAALIGQQRLQPRLADDRPRVAGTIQRRGGSIGRHDGHQPGAHPMRRPGGQPRRAGHLPAGDDGQVAARVFMRLGAEFGRPPEARRIAPGARRDRRQHAVRQADIGQQRLAAQHPPRQQQMAGLQPEEGHGQRRPRREAAHLPGAAIQPGGDIDRQDRHPHGAQRRGDRPIHVARQPGAEHRVDDEAGPRRLGRTEGDPRPAPAGGRPGCIAAWPRRRQRGDRHRPARLFQQPCRDIAIATVVARPGQHQRPHRPEGPPRRPRHRPPGGGHQRDAEDTAGDRRRIGAAHLLRCQQFQARRLRHGGHSPRRASLASFAATSAVRLAGGAVQQQHVGWQARAERLEDQIHQPRKHQRRQR